MAYFNYKNQKVFYKTIGKGTPIILLHGNSVSSKMFKPIIKLYSKKYKLILLDFPGHGKSDRVKKFETDFWHYNAEVTFELIKHLELPKVHIIGTSGGALIGLNLALEHPEKIKSLIADSFEGEYPNKFYISNLEKDRKKDKKKLISKLIWRYCHGKDWRKIVDQDTKVNIDFAKLGNSFFHQSIAKLKVPTLLTGSLKDEYCSHLDKVYRNLQLQNPDLNLYLFQQGFHPAILSNKKEFFQQAIHFINSNK